MDSIFQFYHREVCKDERNCFNLVANCCTFLCVCELQVQEFELRFEK